MKNKDILNHTPLFLEQEQRQFYFEQGYLFFPELIQRTDLASIHTALNDIVEKSRTVTQSSNQIDLEKNHSANNPRLRRVTYSDDHYAALWDICSNSVITDIAADLLGPNVRFRELMINFKWAGGGAEVKWHQDFAFYPHTHTGTLQFLVFLEDVTSDMGPLQVIPNSHKGPLFEHYSDGENDERIWIAALKDKDLQSSGIENAIELTGPAGTVSVHHSCTLHGSASNQSNRGRPVLVITYAAADAIPYTAAPYPSSHYGAIVRGSEPGFALHEELNVPLPPDWSTGYTSIYDHQEQDTK